MMNDEYLGWGPRRAYHHIYVRHLASNFFSILHDKSLKMLLVRDVYVQKPRKFEYGMEWLTRISQDAHVAACITLREMGFIPR